MPLMLLRYSSSLIYSNCSSICIFLDEKCARNKLNCSSTLSSIFSVAVFMASPAIHCRVILMHNTQISNFVKLSDHVKASTPNYPEIPESCPILTPASPKFPRRSPLPVSGISFSGNSTFRQLFKKRWSPVRRYRAVVPNTNNSPCPSGSQPSTLLCYSD